MIAFLLFGDCIREWARLTHWMWTLGTETAPWDRAD